MERRRRRKVRREGVEGGCGGRVWREGVEGVEGGFGRMVWREGVEGCYGGRMCGRV